MAYGIGSRYATWEDAVAGLAGDGATGFSASWLGGVPILACLLGQDIQYGVFSRDGSLEFLASVPMGSGNGSSVPVPGLGACWHCGRGRGRVDSDGCLGELPGVAQACCGHGNSDAYVSFENGVTLRGGAATEHFRSLGLSVPDSREEGFSSSSSGGVGVQTVPSHPFVG